MKYILLLVILCSSYSFSQKGMVKFVDPENRFKLSYDSKIWEAEKLTVFSSISLVKVKKGKKEKESAVSTVFDVTIQKRSDYEIENVVKNYNAMMDTSAVWNNHTTISSTYMNYAGFKACRIYAKADVLNEYPCKWQLYIVVYKGYEFHVSCTTGISFFDKHIKLARPIFESFEIIQE